MRKVIDKKLYDTATATRIFPPDDVASPLNAFLTFREALYCSPKGQLFVCQSNRRETLLGVQTFLEEDIYLLGEEGAFQWLESHNAPQSAYQAAGLQIEIG